MALNSTDNAAFVHAQQYSNFVLTQLENTLIGDVLYRNVSDFGSGTTLNIKTIGSRTLQDVTSEEDMTLNPIDTNTVTLSITDFKGDAVSVPDDFKEDGTQVERLLQESAMETTRLIAEDFESQLLLTAYNAQTAADPNNINGFSHRWEANGGNNQMIEADFIDMALAFDEAKVPQAGRIAIVPPVVAATFNKLATISAGLDRTPQFDAVWNSTFRNDRKFVMNIFGWDVYVSNLCPTLAAGAAIDGTDTVEAEGGRACIFMNVLNDNTKPLMSAWRRTPRTEYKREVSNGGRDEYYTTCRWGQGSQRQDTLGVVVVSATATA